MTDSVRRHYGTDDIAKRILSALPLRRPGQPLEPRLLYPFDQMHGGDLAATRDIAMRLDPKAREKVLDIGSGIGGPARFLANTYRCDVTGIDLTPGFVAAARQLTELCGLSGAVCFDEGDAARMPYPDNSFEGAFSIYVGMNLPDRAAVLKEAARVLKPGGRLVWAEAMLTGRGAVSFPLPWAKTADASFLGYADRLEDTIITAGFDRPAISNVTPEILAPPTTGGLTPAERQARERTRDPDFSARRQNYIKALESGVLVSLVAEARKP